MVDTVTLDDSGKGSGEAVCTALDETGNVAPNTISVQGENIAGIESVTNPTQASGGTEIETDDAYRQR
ncbi:baseplate J/gp47 family protein, partial [Mycobacterium tuberculosis]